VNIVGVGNMLMGDDGVGSAAVERLERMSLPEGARLVDAGLAVSDILCGLDPDEPLLVIDAFMGGGRAGDLYRVPLTDLCDGRTRRSGAISLHEVSVLPALRMEAMTGRTFRHVTLFGVEPGRIEWGAELSPEVAGALDALVEDVKECVWEFFENHPGDPLCASAAQGDLLS